MLTLRRMSPMLGLRQNRRTPAFQPRPVNLEPRLALLAIRPFPLMTMMLSPPPMIVALLSICVPGLVTTTKLVLLMEPMIGLLMMATKSLLLKAHLSCVLTRTTITRADITTRLLLPKTLLSSAFLIPTSCLLSSGLLMPTRLLLSSALLIPKRYL